MLAKVAKGNGLDRGPYDRRDTEVVLRAVACGSTAKGVEDLAAWCHAVNQGCVEYAWITKSNGRGGCTTHLLARVCVVRCHSAARVLSTRSAKKHLLLVSAA